MHKPSSLPPATHGIISHLPIHPWKSLLPELSKMAWERFPHAVPLWITPHSHVAYEFTYVVDGGISWCLGDERIDIGPGELFFTRPRELHSGTDGAMHPSEILWVQIIVPESGPFLGWSENAVKEIHARLSGTHARRFSAPPEIARTFKDLIRVHQMPIDALSTVRASTLLSSLLVQIADARAEHIATNAIKSTPPSPLISAAINWMETHLEETFTIQNVADAVGLHPSRFHRCFVAEMKQTPAEWHMRQRILTAQKLLKDKNANVTEVALQLGFASSQYFSTVFKKYTGYTPSVYRQGLESKMGAEASWIKLRSITLR
jgi:AraC-like DNA-binding protein/mannose-6-phosphate isomerase-like protein (cupin superfamily)